MGIARSRRAHPNTHTQLTSYNRGALGCTTAEGFHEGTSNAIYRTTASHTVHLICVKNGLFFSLPEEQRRLNDSFTSNKTPQDRLLSADKDRQRHVCTNWPTDLQILSIMNAAFSIPDFKFKQTE